MRFKRAVVGILPFFIVKMVMRRRYLGEQYFMRAKGCATEWTAQGYEFDFGEWFAIADREALLKERAVIERRLKRNQDRLDELKKLVQ